MAERMTSEKLALEIWTRAGRPVKEVWTTPKQGAFLLSLLEREGSRSVYGTHFQEIEVAGFEDREADLRVYETFSGRVSITVRIHKTEEELAAYAEAAQAKTGAGWF